MDLGDEELNFRPEVAEEWADEFPRARRVHGPAARPSEEELAGVHFALLMFALLMLVGVAIMAMIGECHKEPETPNQPAAPSVTQSQIRTQVQETRSAPTAPPVPLPAAEPGETQLPATVFASRLVHVPALPGETEGMNIEVDTKSEDGSLSLVGAPPPGMDLAFLGGAEIREAPDGELAGLAPKGAQFIYRIQMYAQPCWRWLVSLDGEYEGYACFYTVHDQQNESTTQPEEEYLPDGWGVGILTSEMVVRDSPDGDSVATFGAGTWVLFKYDPEDGGWRKVVTIDGNFWGYARFRPSAPCARRPVRPEYKKGLEIVRRLEIGSSYPIERR